MTTQWERFAARSPFTIDALGGEKAVEIYNGSTDYTPGEGNENTYDLQNPDATLDAETMAPSAVSGIEDAGTFEGASQVAFIASDYPDRTFSQDTTIDSDRVDTFDNVTVESGVTLTVNGILQVNSITVNGEVVTNGEVRTFSGLLESLISYDDENNPPTIVHILENDFWYDLQELTEQGDGYLRLMLMER